MTKLWTYVIVAAVAVIAVLFSVRTCGQMEENELEARADSLQAVVVELQEVNRQITEENAKLDSANKLLDAEIKQVAQRETDQQETTDTLFRDVIQQAPDTLKPLLLKLQAALQAERQLAAQRTVLQDQKIFNLEASNLRMRVQIARQDSALIALNATLQKATQPKGQIRKLAEATPYILATLGIERLVAHVNK